MTLSAAAHLLVVGQSLYLVNPGPVPTKAPIIAVREMPAEVVARARENVQGCFQVQIKTFGSEAWVNASPEMVTFR